MLTLGEEKVAYKPRRPYVKVGEDRLRTNVRFAYKTFDIFLYAPDPLPSLSIHC
jgi:hypothetical protein